MKKNIVFFLLFFITTITTSCYREAGVDTLFDLKFPEFDLLTKGGALQNMAVKGYSKTIDNVSIKDTFFITYSSRPTANPVAINYSVTPISREAKGDTVKAIEGTHYRLASSGSVNVPAGSVLKTYIPLEIIDDNMLNGKTYIFNIKLSSEGSSQNKNYEQMDFVFRLCPFSATTFTGAYTCREPGYDASADPNGNPDGTYRVSITPINATTVRNNNFWNFGSSSSNGIQVSYIFDDNAKTVQLIPRMGVAVPGVGNIDILSGGAGIYDSCSGRFSVPYKIVTAGTTSEIEAKTHTFYK
jgi:hypothetical protein